MPASECERGVFARQCADGLDRMASLIRASVTRDVVTLLDWPEIRRYADELICRAAIADAGLDRDQFRSLEELSHGE